MKFQKAEAELILFDNSDVIVTSPHDVYCYAKPQKATCSQQGDSEEPNECAFIVGTYCDTFLVSIVAPHECEASGNEYFVNSPGPNNPVSM